MLRLAWRGVRHNVGRYVATLVAIMTGVAFFTATGFVSDRVIRALEGDVDSQYGGIGAAVVVEDQSAQNSQIASELRIGADAAEAVAALPEVEAVGGDLSGSVSFLAPDGDTFADGATGRLWIADDELNPIDLAEGSPPSGPGQIAVDKGLADDEDLAIGDELQILTLAGQFDVQVVGITSFGSSDALDQNGTVSIDEANAFDWLNSGQVEYEALYARGDVSPDELVAALDPVVPDGFKAQTGDQFRSDVRDERAGIGRFLKLALQLFAVIALFVGGFVIYNTFNVIVAQRLRELAVMAAIGATPKQIKRSLRYEGLVIGVLGSALGVVAGFGLAFVLMLALQAFGFALPGSGIVVGVPTVVQGMLAGTLITFLSVRAPARRAARTEPIEALRQSAVEASPLSRQRITTAAVLVGLGVLMMLVGSAALVGLGAIVLFVGVIVSGPIVAVYGSRLARPIFKGFGLEGRLAVDNTARNPQRTATTANALLIGVFLVTLVSVAGTSLKDFAVAEINKLSSADYVISSDGGTIDPELVGDLEAIKGVDSVTPFRHEAVTLDGEPAAISTGDLAALTDVANIEFVEGSFDDLGPGKIVLVDDGADDRPLGTVVEVTNSKGTTEQFEVVGIIKNKIDTNATGNLLDEQAFDEFVGATAPTFAFVDLESGAQTDTEDAIKDRTDLRPDITLLSGNEIGRLIGNVFDFLINAVNGLLLMSVVVALIGIVNTLSLSILERRRELGLLRVVGMVDRRVQRMVRLESVLIAGLGTVTGLLLGLFCGYALIFSIDRQTEANIGFSFAGLRLLLILVLGILLGFLAALIPARRSTRLEVLDAIQAT